jgi:hypothetical protein
VSAASGFWTLCFCCAVSLLFVNESHTPLKNNTNIFFLSGHKYMKYFGPLTRMEPLFLWLLDGRVSSEGTEFKSAIRHKDTN